jgi:hypothetical protein
MLQWINTLNDCRRTLQNHKTLVQTATNCHNKTRGFWLSYKETIHRNCCWEATAETFIVHGVCPTNWDANLWTTPWKTVQIARCNDNSYKPIAATCWNCSRWSWTLCHSWLMITLFMKQCALLCITNQSLTWSPGTWKLYLPPTGRKAMYQTKTAKLFI